MAVLCKGQWVKVQRGLINLLWLHRSVLKTPDFHSGSFCVFLNNLTFISASSGLIKIVWAADAEERCRSKNRLTWRGSLNCCVLTVCLCWVSCKFWFFLPCHTDIFTLIRLNHTSNCANLSRHNCRHIFIPQEQELFLICTELILCCMSDYDAPHWLFLSLLVPCFSFFCLSSWSLIASIRISVCFSAVVLAWAQQKRPESLNQFPCRPCGEWHPDIKIETLLSLHINTFSLLWICRIMFSTSM